MDVAVGARRCLPYIERAPGGPTTGNTNRRQGSECAVHPCEERYEAQGSRRGAQWGSGDLGEERYEAKGI
jgi:hypothetical protein